MTPTEWLVTVETTVNVQTIYVRSATRAAAVTRAQIILESRGDHIRQTLYIIPYDDTRRRAFAPPTVDHP